MTPQEHLRQERHSYVVGSLLVLGLIIVAGTLLSLMLFSWKVPQNWSEALAMGSQLSPQQRLEMQILMWAGGAALFFLNLRFSLILRRPVGAFSAGASTTRALWWVVLFLNSIFCTLVVPQLVVTWLLARWGREAIARLDDQAALDRRSGEPPPGSPNGDAGSRLPEQKT